MKPYLTGSMKVDASLPATISWSRHPDNALEMLDLRMSIGTATLIIPFQDLPAKERRALTALARKQEGLT